MIKKLSLIFGSKTKAQEIVLLLQDAKEVVRQGFTEEELFKVEQFCKWGTEIKPLINSVYVSHSSFPAAKSLETNLKAILCNPFSAGCSVIIASPKLAILCSLIIFIHTNEKA